MRFHRKTASGWWRSSMTGTKLSGLGETPGWRAFRLQKENFNPQPDNTISKPYIHALSSAKKFGGKPEDYIDIHTFMDSSKGTIADNRHRALTHNAWFIMTVLERVRFAKSYIYSPEQAVFTTILNSDGKQVSVRDIG